MNDLNSIKELPFAYKAGNNPAGEKAYYSCAWCGFAAHANEVAFIGAGTNYANGEYAKCPKCARENEVYRDSLE